MSDTKEPSAEKRVTSAVHSSRTASASSPEAPVNASRRSDYTGQLPGQASDPVQSEPPELASHKTPPASDATTASPANTYSTPASAVSPPSGLAQNAVPNIRIVPAGAASPGDRGEHQAPPREAEATASHVGDRLSRAEDPRIENYVGNSGSQAALPETSGKFCLASIEGGDVDSPFNLQPANGNDKFGLVEGESGEAGDSNRQCSTSTTAVPTQLWRNPFTGVYDRGKKKKRKGAKHFGKETQTKGCNEEANRRVIDESRDTHATPKSSQDPGDAHLHKSNTHASLASNQLSLSESCDSPSGQWDSTTGGAGSSLQSPDLLSPPSLLEDSGADDIVSPHPPSVHQSPSKWAKLRTTLKMAGAVSTNVAKKRHRKTSTLMRQDSFLKRFSTRHGGGATTISEESDEEEKNKYEQNQIQREQQERHVRRFIIHPDENFMFIWLGVVCVAVMYNLWTCIAREAFPQVVQGHEYIWIASDVFCDLIYLLDITVQLRTGYLERGLMVSNNKMLAGHYLRSKYFILDLCSLLPLDLAQIVIGIHPILRFPRFLKLYRSYRFVYMVETRTVYPNTWRVVNLTHVLFLGSHWFAAFYFMISKAEGFRGGWGYPFPEGEWASVTRMYLKSLYWSTLTLTTIGDLPPPESNWQ